jgi:hypothetical protein
MFGWLRYAECSDTVQTEKLLGLSRYDFLLVAASKVSHRKIEEIDFHGAPTLILARRKE